MKGEHQADDPVIDWNAYHETKLKLPAKKQQEQNHGTTRTNKPTDDSKSR